MARTRRREQVNELIKRELSQIILREFDSPKNCLVTITDVKTAPNFSSSKIYISVIPESRSREILQRLSRQIYSIQQILNKRLKMRPVPKIIFFPVEIISPEAKLPQSGISQGE